MGHWGICSKKKAFILLLSGAKYYRIAFESFSFSNHFFWGPALLPKFYPKFYLIRAKAYG